MHHYPIDMLQMHLANKYIKHSGIVFYKENIWNNKFPVLWLQVSTVSCNGLRHTLYTSIGFGKFLRLEKNGYLHFIESGDCTIWSCNCPIVMLQILLALQDWCILIPALTASRNRSSKKVGLLDMVFTYSSFSWGRHQLWSWRDSRERSSTRLPTIRASPSR